MKFNRSCSAQFHEFFKITSNFLFYFMIFRNFEQMKPLKFFEQLGSVEKFRNMINVGRGAISYVNLEQDDPPSKRPACLFVSSLTSSSYTSSQVSKFSCKRRIVYFSFLLLLVFKINVMLVAFLVTFSKMWPLFLDVQSLYVQMKYFSSKCSFYSYLKKAF